MRINLIATLALLPAIFVSPVSAQSGAFQQLKGPEIELLFTDIQEFGYPNDSLGDHRCDMTYLKNGTWDAEITTGSSYDAYGTWRVENDEVCIVVRGGDLRFLSPYEGCFAVLVDRSDGVVAGKFKEKDTPLVLLDDVATEIASLLGPATAPEKVESATRPQMAVSRPPKPTKPSTTRNLEAPETPKVAVAPEAPKATVSKPAASSADSLKHQLELQKLALERQRLEAETKLQQMKLELEMARLRQQGTSGASQKAVQAPAPLIPDIAYGNYYALVIGINDYKALPKLKTAVTDAETVAKLLKELYGFKVTLLVNASRADIIDAFDEYRDLLAEEDNLLIYYAGHGWLDPQTQAGYWLPVNAKPDRRSRWVSNATLTTALQGLLAKHVLVVADSCYSGTLTRSVKVPQRNRAYLKRISEKRARVVLSSGGLEPVADSGGGQHSVFAAQFLKALKTNEGVLDGTQLFEKVRQSVVLNADQTPEYSNIRRAGHEGGDFLFVRKR